MVDAKNTFDEILEKIFGSHAEALAYSENPTEYLVAEGLGEADMGSLNITQSVEGACSAAGMEPQMAQSVSQAASRSYSSSSSSSSSSASSSASASASAAATPPPPTLQHVQEVVSQTVTVIYEGDEVIIQNIDNSTNIDNSVDVDVDIDGIVDGDINVDTDVYNTNATGDGAVAVGGDNDGQINTGDGAVQAGGDIKDSDITTGDGNIDVDGDAVIGDGNQTVQGSDDVNAAFGEGDVNDFEGANIEDSNVNVGDGNAIADTETNTQLEINDSFNDESVNLDLDLGREAPVRELVPDDPTNGVEELGREQADRGDFDEAKVETFEDPEMAPDSEGEEEMPMD